MPIRPAAIFVAAICFASLCPAQEPRVLTLDAAYARVLEKHPDLARFAFSREGAEAALESEGQRAPLRLDLEVVDSSESTLSFASVYERGGKRAARAAVAGAQRSALDTEEQQRRADLIAEVARRYLDVLAAQVSRDLAATELTQRERAAESAAQRVRAGATPESVRLAAEAAAVRAGLQRDRAGTQADAAARRLAVLWNSREPDFDRATGDVMALPRVASLESLRALIDRSPELRRFATESRLREARVQLARARQFTDIEWSAGVRRLEEEGAWAAVVGVSVPLGSAARAAPGIRAAQAELTALSLERESESMTLEATLSEAWSQWSAASAEVQAGHDRLLPKLEQAERSSERAFRAGALTYAEWSQIQADVTAARREQLSAALEAHRAHIEIQRLTGSQP